GVRAVRGQEQGANYFPWLAIARKQQVVEIAGVEHPPEGAKPIGKLPALEFQQRRRIVGRRQLQQNIAGEILGRLVPAHRLREVVAQFSEIPAARLEERLRRWQIIRDTWPEKATTDLHSTSADLSQMPQCRLMQRLPNATAVKLRVDVQRKDGARGRGAPVPPRCRTADNPIILARDKGIAD